MPYPDGNLASAKGESKLPRFAQLTIEQLNEQQRAVAQEMESIPGARVKL
jgi:hypothetical protein